MKEAPLDVLIVGAGPAGCSAAYHLARGGAKVCLAEQSNFPRDKACGGAISALGQDCLVGMGLGEWAESQSHCRRIAFVGPRSTRASWEMRGAKRRALFIPRLLLDQALLNAAGNAGVETALGTRVLGIELLSDGVRLQTGHKLPEAKLLILAEGADAPLAAALGLVRKPPEFAAMRTHYAYDAEGVAEYHYIKKMLPCIAWALPAGPGTVNVGVSAMMRDVRSGAIDLSALLRRFTYEGAYAGRLQGLWPVDEPSWAAIRCNLSSVRPYAERVLLAGDAAGVAHPLSNEGVGAAMESGRIVAQHALYALQRGRFSASDLSAYGLALYRRFGIEHRVATSLRGWLRSERVMERIIGRAQRDRNFAMLMTNLFLGTQSSLGTLTPANVLRYLMWWKPKPRELP